MFVDIVTIEKDATESFANEDITIFSTRVSFRTGEPFQMVDKEGKAGKTNFTYMDASFVIRKYPEDGAAADAPKKLSISMEQLKVGAQVFVQGDIGIDVVPKKGDTKEKSYFTKLKSSRVRLIDGATRKPREAAAPAATDEAAPKATAKAKAEDDKKIGGPALQPRKPADQGDAVPAGFFY